MSGTVRWLAAGVLAALVIVCGCYGQSDSASQPAGRAPAAPAQTYPDPGLETAAEVQGAIRAYVAQQAGADRRYAIPPRGDRSVSGTLATFHTVHQQDADHYSVCVDFVDGSDTYDVDFIVAREGMAIRDHWLHKVNGEVVE